MRLRALKLIVCPADLESLETIRAAGGMSKLRPEQLPTTKISRIPIGESCDDLPEVVQQILIDRGLAEIVAGAGSPPAGLSARNASDLAEMAAAADVETLDAIEAAEKGRDGKPRVTVTRAIDRRRAELQEA